jgi:glycerol-3-phosphate dehydrogenase
VSAAPAAARQVTELLRREGLKLETDEKFSPFRKAPPVFNELPQEQKKELIARDGRYGHVVCRCETVSEGEIVEAIRHGATTLDGIKFRTRAGMGRCQGGFCTPRVVKILARELGMSEEKITKKGGESRLLLYKSKELLEVQL